MRRALPLALLLGAVAARAQTYKYLDFKNLSDVQHPFQYYIDDRQPMPQGLTIADLRAATDRAWGKWDAVSCAVPKSQSMGFAGQTVPQPSNPYDVFNVTPVFVTSNADPYYRDVFTFGFTAVALPLQYAGVLQVCDIYLNGTQATFSTTAQPASNTVDVESTMLHETGHCLGLDHNYESDVMRTSIFPGIATRSLSPYDVDLLCRRYPANGQVLSLCPDGGGCGAGLKCLTQAAASGPPHRFCTRGCPVMQNAMCEIPLTCQTSSAFSPSFDGACLRPGANVTQVGRPCFNDPECGSNVGYCKRPVVSGTTTFWRDGHCTQSCAPGQPPCPAGSMCTQVGEPSPICLQSCRVGFADCRQGYTCASTVNGGVCAPRCEVNADCCAAGQACNYACRTCDGLCVEVNSQTQPGDVCDTDATCGFGQTCVNLDRRSPVRLCTSGCGTGCESCPSGSQCHPVPSAGGQFFCLRSCTGSNTCPAGLQCSNLPTGRGCLPPCQLDQDCPVGTTCNNGECGNPMGDPDGGCGLLCTAEDGGIPIKPKPKDAGMGPGGSGGCGCNSSPASLLFGLMGLSFLVSRSRSSPWRRRRP